MSSARPVGISSRLRRAAGGPTEWISPTGQRVTLPVVLDIAQVNASGAVDWLVEAAVDLVNGEPAITSMSVVSASGLDTERLQNDFRWATPLEVVTVTVPQLLEKGVDPYEHDYATRGYPDAADLARTPQRQLSDAFLAEVSRRYLAQGRGYAVALAHQYQVTPRTVVSWIEKARARGILSATTPGVAGGHIKSSETS